jgi:hypothetical protein
MVQALAQAVHIRGTERRAIDIRQAPKRRGRPTCVDGTDAASETAAAGWRRRRIRVCSGRWAWRMGAGRVGNGSTGHTCDAGGLGASAQRVEGDVCARRTRRGVPASCSLLLAGAGRVGVMVASSRCRSRLPLCGVAGGSFPSEVIGADSIHRARPQLGRLHTSTQLCAQ